MTSARAQQGGLRSPSAGFTLIELLVVIAMIALLVTILLPSLSRAKEMAKAVLCRVELREASKAQLIYTTEFEGHMAGPNGSGYALRTALKAGGRPRPDLWEGASKPAAHDDWVSPTLGEQFGLPADRPGRIVGFFNHNFRCPSNDLTYRTLWSSAPHNENWPDPKTISINSYSAPISLYAYNDAAHAKKKGQPNGFHWYSGREQGVVDPSFSRFNGRIDSIGPPDTKVACMDGSRYVKEENGHEVVDFNLDASTLAFPVVHMTHSPCLRVYPQDKGNPYKFASSVRSSGQRELHPLAVKYAYRHLDETLNMAFFDGHVGPYGNEESRPVRYWFPSGSKVMSVDVLGDLRAGVGDVVD